jgi:hypothetical protein
MIHNVLFAFDSFSGTVFDLNGIHLFNMALASIH